MIPIPNKLINETQRLCAQLARKFELGSKALLVQDRELPMMRERNFVLMKAETTFVSIF